MSEWFSKGRIFLEEARKLHNNGIYWLSCFHAHQAAELYLKGFLIVKVGTYPFTHDLEELIDVINQLGIDIPNDVLEAAQNLTPHYITSRYPREKSIKYTKRKSELCISYAEKIIEWIESIIEKS